MAAQQIGSLPPVFREGGQEYKCKPICRACAEKHNMNARNLHPYPHEHRCEVKACDGRAAYLAIDC